jgi:hypothetical protein
MSDVSVQATVSFIITFRKRRFTDIISSVADKLIPTTDVGRLFDSPFAPERPSSLIRIPSGGPHSGFPRCRGRRRDAQARPSPGYYLCLPLRGLHHVMDDLDYVIDAPRARELAAHLGGVGLGDRPATWRVYGVTIVTCPLSRA